ATVVGMGRRPRCSTTSIRGLGNLLKAFIGHESDGGLASSAGGAERLNTEEKADPGSRRGVWRRRSREGTHGGGGRGQFADRGTSTSPRERVQVPALLGRYHASVGASLPEGARCLRFRGRGQLSGEPGDRELPRRPDQCRR